MDLKVSIVKNHKVVDQKVVANPKPGEVTQAIADVLIQIRQRDPTFEWPWQVDVREA